MAIGKKTGGGSRKGVPNKSRDEVRELIDRVGKPFGGMEMVFKRLFELADGITLQETDKKGEARIYTRAPSELAIKELNDRRYGKSAQPVSANVRGTITVVVKNE